MVRRLAATASAPDSREDLVGGSISPVIDLSHEREDSAPASIEPNIPVTLSSQTRVDMNCAFLPDRPRNSFAIQQLLGLGNGSPNSHIPHTSSGSILSSSQAGYMAGQDFITTTAGHCFPGSDSGSRFAYFNSMHSTCGSNPVFHPMSADVRSGMSHALSSGALVLRPYLRLRT